MSFHINCFEDDQIATKFNLKSKRYISIDQNSKLYSLLVSYIAENTYYDYSGSESFEAVVLPATIKNKTKQTNNKFERITLEIGYGCFRFYSNKNEPLIAFKQRLGDPVGTNCGPMVLSRLTIFTDDSIESLGIFLSDIVKQSEESSEGTVICYGWHLRHHYWRKEADIKARPLESVVLPLETKERLLKDVEKFLQSSTQEFCNNHGIPYRRSYLFHGLPGTGKTSMVQAIAGRFKRNICYLMPTHPEMTDDGLREAIMKVPDDSIVVFEDIDSLFAKDRSNKVSKSTLTFSGLLNALDGIGNSNGQIYILTTNLRDQLDPALIRKGRVDRHIEFTYANKEQMEQMWNNFYPDSLNDACQFSESIMKLLKDNDMQITTSSLQHYFVTEMESSAEEALAHIQSIVDEVRYTDAEIKQKKALSTETGDETEVESKKSLGSESIAAPLISTVTPDTISLSTNETVSIPLSTDVIQIVTELVVDQGAGDVK